MRTSGRSRRTGAGRARVLIYSHDTYGLGHVRRSLLIAGRLASTPYVGSTVIVTGSPRAQAFQLPPGCDTVKLPSVTKTPAGRYRTRTLNVPLQDVIRLRAELAKATFQAFRPDLVLVDHAPLGMLGELEPLVEAAELSTSRPRFALGLRDVIDAAPSLHDEWSDMGVWPAIDSLYDRILVYGDPSVTTTAQELGLPERPPSKCVHVGYLGRPIPHRRAGLEPSILVTTGGGGDGHDLLRAYAAYLESLK